MEIKLTNKSSEKELENLTRELQFKNEQHSLVVDQLTQNLKKLQNDFQQQKDKYQTKQEQDHDKI